MSMVKVQAFVLCNLLLVSAVSFAQKTEAHFDVFFKDEKIGRLHAQKTMNAAKSFEELRTETDATFCFFLFINPFYIYKEGKLVSMEVNTKVGEVVSHLSTI